MIRSLHVTALALATLAPSGFAGILVSTDFTAPLDRPPEAFGTATASDASVPATAAITPDGTIDSFKGKPGTAVTLTADFSAAGSAPAKAGLVVGPFPVKNLEAALGRLSFGFDVWINHLRPVRVVVTSLDADGKPTGSLTTTVLPPVADVFYRFNVDLDQMKPREGKFDPLAPQVQFAFELDDADDPKSHPRTTDHILRVDNLSYTAPTFFVSPNGSDSADGRTDATPFATIQKAIDSSAPGDVILLAGGTYRSEPKRHLARFREAAAPDKWIVLRAAPGQKPILNGDAFDVVYLDQQAAYIELRGLTVKGNREKLKLADAHKDGTAKKEDGKPAAANSIYNTNGLSANGRNSDPEARPHHLRFINNAVIDNTGGGISAIGCDHVVIEGNLVANNAHLMRFGGSGISVLESWNFDEDNNYKTWIVRNVAHHNRTYVPWVQPGHISDGNGIIIDLNNNSNRTKIPYVGRTLVQNNLVFGNGGSGIHAFGSNHVDIVNNTAYHNAQAPELTWRQIYAGSQSTDIHIFNNIVWAQRGHPTHFKTGYKNEDISYSYNLIFGDGDNDAPEVGGTGIVRSYSGEAANEGNVFANPGFVRPSLNAAVADFRLRADSPALDQARSPRRGVPRNDLLDEPRPQGAAPDMGAYERPASAP